MRGTMNLKPSDIDACHIFPWAWHDAVITCLNLLSAQLILDSGCPTDCKKSAQTAARKITAALNTPAIARYVEANMIPLRADVHGLWDVYEIGVDVYVSTPIP